LTTLDTITGTASDLGKNAIDSIEDLRRSAGRKLDNVRDQTGDALHAAASSVRTTGRQSSKAIDEFATDAAKRLDATASYIEDTDVTGMFTGVWNYARRYPARSLVAAVAIGFFVGSAFGRQPPPPRRRSS
jgi:hypothetical protein